MIYLRPAMNLFRLFLHYCSNGTHARIGALDWSLRQLRKRRPLMSRDHRTKYHRTEYRGQPFHRPQPTQMPDKWSHNSYHQPLPNRPPRRQMLGLHL
jgi:hypothetical protein